MNLKIGDRVIFDGIISEIETFWSQMNHVYFRLSDGRVIIDAHKISDDNPFFQVISETSKINKMAPSIVSTDKLPSFLKKKLDAKNQED